MHIVIIGAGRVGSRLAKLLVLEGHDVALVDSDPAAFARLGDDPKIRRVDGVGFDLDVLQAADIERADAFIAVTNKDNANVVGSLVAKRRYRVPKVVARIYDPLRERMYQALGIQTISSTSWAANKIKSMITHVDLIRHMSFGNGEVEILEAEVPPQLEGRKVSDLSIPVEIQVIAIIRFGRAFVPTGSTVLEGGDGIAFSATTTAIPTIEKLLHLA
jgi:trk system potassium uptake protein